MRDGGRRCRDRALVIRREHRLLAVGHLPVRHRLAGQIELPEVAAQVACVGRGDDLVAIAHQRHAAQTVGLGIAAHARVQPRKDIARRQLDHQQLGTSGAALVAIARHHHPSPIGQHAHLRFLQHMTDGIAMGLHRLVGVAQLPQHGILQPVEVGVRHIHGEHRLRPCPGGTHHHISPLAAPVGIPLDQRAVHHETGLETGSGRGPQLRQRCVGRKGEDLAAAILGRIGIGIEAVQEALIAAHENHRGAADLRSAPLEDRAATARHLLCHVGGVALCARRGVAKGRRQVAVAPIDRCTNVDRLRIDDVADDGALQLLAECLAGLAPVPAQIHHQLAAVTLPLERAVAQSLLRVRAHRVPEERRGGRTRPGPSTHVHAPVNGLGQIVQHAPLARALVAGSIHGISRQVTGPVLRLERRHELLIVGLKRPRGDRHARRAAGAAGDVCQDTRHFRQEAAAVSHVDVLAVTIDGGVPEVIDGRRAFRLDPARPLPRAVHDALQAIRVRDVPFHAESQRVGGDVLPERRVSIIGRDQIVQIRTQVTFPGVHRIVGQRTPGRAHEGANGLVLIRGVDLALTAARPMIDNLLA